MKKKLFWVAVLVCLICLVFVSSALAVSGTVGGVSCTATKTITTNWGTTWTSYIYSTAQSSIGTIGWTYWTDREYCNGVIVHSISHGARASYGDNREASSSTNGFNSSCSGGVQKVDTTGNHDFRHNNDTWRPLVTSSKTRP